MPRTPKYNTNWIPSPGASLKLIFQKCALNQRQDNEMQTLHVSDDARMRIWYIFCRSKSLTQLFVNFWMNAMKLEYTTFWMVWASSRIRLHFVQRKYTMFVVCSIKNRLAARCFYDDCLWTPSENTNKRKSCLTHKGRTRNHYERSVWRKKVRAAREKTQEC